MQLDAVELRVQFDGERVANDLLAGDGPAFLLEDLLHAIRQFGQRSVVLNRLDRDARVALGLHGHQHRGRLARNERVDDEAQVFERLGARGGEDKGQT